MIIKFSRKALRESISKLLKENEDGVLVDDSPMPGVETQGPDDMTGVKGAASQACNSLSELVKQCSALGGDCGDYLDMIDQIHADFGLPGGTAEVDQ